MDTEPVDTGGKQMRKSSMLWTSWSAQGISRKHGQLQQIEKSGLQLEHTEDSVLLAKLPLLICCKWMKTLEGRKESCNRTMLGIILVTFMRLCVEQAAHTGSHEVGKPHLQAVWIWDQWLSRANMTVLTHASGRAMRPYWGTWIIP